MGLVANAIADLVGKFLVTREDNETLTGLKTFDRGAGAAPFAVASSSAAPVTNLDADKLDGFHASDLRDASLLTGTLPDAVVPNPLPAVSGERLTNIQASNIVGLQSSSHYATIPNLAVVSGFTPKPIDGSFLGTSAATLYTCPASTWAIVRSLRVVNYSTTTRYVVIYQIPSGGSASNAKALLNTSLLPGESLELPGPIVFEDGDFMQGLAEAATAISFRADLVEFTAQPSGVTLKPIDLSAPAATTWTTLYTAPSRTIVDRLGVVNSNASARYAVLAVVPSGQAVANGYVFCDLGLNSASMKLLSRETAIPVGLDNPLVLETGDTLQAYVEVASDIAIGGSVREYA